MTTALNYRTKKVLVGYVFILPWLIGFLGFQLIPMVWSFVLSFFRYDIITTPRYIGIENYLKMFRDPIWIKSVKVTFYYVLVTVPLRMAISLMMALLLNAGIKGKGIFRTIFYLPTITSAVAISILWKSLYNPKFGAINNFLALLGIEGPNWLIDSHWAMPSIMIMSIWAICGRYMIIFLAGLQTIPVHLYESSTIDGATRWKKFRYITLPVLSPTIYLVSVMAFIQSFQVFTYAFMFMAENQGESMVNASSIRVYILYLYESAFQNLKMGYASAMAWMLFFLILLITLVQNYVQKKTVYYESTR